MDFYSRFTDRFRGSQQDIKARLKVYLPLLEPILARYPEAPVIDLGSGRGEWLELLKEQGWQGKGIDTSIAMADACRARGLAVDIIDALSGLKDHEADSVSAITGFHIAEHMPFDDLVTLVGEAYRVLKPGGVLILETPNPENLTVGLWSFYMDPTHRHPLPPPLLHFVAEDSGFERADVLRLNGPEPPGDDTRLAEQFDWALSAHPDYALIAHKRPVEDTPGWFDYLQRLTEEHQGGIAHFAAQIEVHEQRDLAQQQRIEHLEQELIRIAVDKQYLNDQLSAVLVSHSWRLTAPLRHAMLWRRHAGISSGVLMRRLAQVPWVKRAALLLLDRSPALKSRVLRHMADSQGAPLTRRPARSDDFLDLDPPRLASVREESVTLRDRHLPHQAIASTLKGLLIEGHFDGSYSLAAVNRHLVCRLLADNPVIEIALVPHESERQTSVRHIPGDGNQLDILNRQVSNKSFDSLPAGSRVCLYHHYPLIKDLDPVRGLPVALFFWEESWVPDDMIATLNAHYVGVIVTAWFVKKALMDSGCRLPVQVIALPLVANRLAASSKGKDLQRVNEQQRVRLLHVSSAFPRKGVDVLLAAFNRLAARLESVELTLKTFPNPHNRVESLIEQNVDTAIRSRIHLIMEDYDAEQMAALYQGADIVVLPTRGEGLNMPAIEAGEFSRPLVVTGHGAHTDFAGQDNTWWVAYAFDHAQSHFATGQSVWVEPGIDSLSERLHTLSQALLEGQHQVVDRAARQHQQIQQRFHDVSATDSVLSALARVQRHVSKQNGDEEPLSIALFTSWGEACGIAEYSTHLAKAMQQQGARIEVQAPRERIDQAVPQDIESHESWRFGTPPSLESAHHSQVLWLQHHFAFYPLNHALASNVKEQRRLGKRVFITLHTTRPLLDFEANRRQAAGDALLACDRVFVHTVDDLNSLKRIGVTDNVTLMAQGVADAETAIEAVHQPDEPPAVGSFGFLFPHKGIHELINAFADLHHAQRLPADTRLRLVTAVRNEPSSRQELTRCQRAAKARGVDTLVDWHTDFLPLDEVRRLLAGCKLLVLPYQYTQESSSAAVRTAIAACPDIATTPAPIFDELRDISWRIDGFGVADIAQTIERVLDDASADNAAVLHQARQEWLLQRSWHTLAQRYAGLFHSTLVDRDITHTAEEPV